MRASKKGVIGMNTPFGNMSTNCMKHDVANDCSPVAGQSRSVGLTHAGKWEKSKFMGVRTDRNETLR